jgi:hypothetical protein
MSRFYRRTVPVILLALVIFATIAKALLNEINKGLHTKPWPAFSVAEAKGRGTLVCEVEVTPRTLVWREHEIEIKEVWVEEVATQEYFLAWFPYWARTGDRYLCRTWAKGTEWFPKPWSYEGACVSMKPFPPIQPGGFILGVGPRQIEVWNIGTADVLPMQATVDDCKDWREDPEWRKAHEKANSK